MASRTSRSVLTVRLVTVRVVTVRAVTDSIGSVSCWLVSSRPPCCVRPRRTALTKRRAVDFCRVATAL